MKKMRWFSLGFLFPGVFIGINIFAQNINPADFQKKMQALPNAPLVDVRTPAEFNQSRLNNAINININDQNFPNLINNLDKNKPVLIYCLTGSRSAYAANYMHSLGFKTIYDLSGGLMKWRGEGLPETSGKTNADAGMSMLQFNTLLNTDKLVLVDVYADWCAPCIKMAPSLQEIKEEMSARVKLVRINADQNKTLLKELNITALPVLLLYKSKKVIWTNTGFLTKEEIVSHFNQ